MDDDRHLSNLPRVSGLHPVVYKTLAGSVVWTVGALFALFSDNSETRLQLAVVAVFAAAFVGVPLWLMRISKVEPDPRHLPFGEWVNTRFEIAGGSVKAGEAALLVLLAPLSCALGLTAFAFIRLVIAS